MKLPRFDITVILTGDWLGSLTTALATLATAFGLSTLVVALMHPNGTSAKGFLALATMITASAFGGDFTVSTHNTGDPATILIDYGAYPLTITAAALIVAGFLLSRQLRAYPDWTGRVAHAVRTAIILGAGLIAITALLSANLDPQQALALGLFDRPLILDIPGAYHAKVASTALLGAIWMLLTAAVLILLRDQTLPGPVNRVRDWIALPLKSIGVLFAAATLTGLVGAIVIYFTDDQAHNTSAVAVWVAALPNLGLTIIYVGAGAAFHIVTSGGGLTHTHSNHLAYITAHYTHGLWFAPAATLLTLTVSALYVPRRSAAVTIPANILRWLAGLIVATPVLIHLSALHGADTWPGKKQPVYRFAVGVDQWQAIGLIAIWGFVIALVIAGVTRTRSTHQESAPVGTSQPPPPHAGESLVRREGSTRRPRLAGARASAAMLRCEPTSGGATHLAGGVGLARARWPMGEHVVARGDG